MVRTKLFEEEDGLREPSESVPLVVVVEEEEGEDAIKSPSWIDLTIASRGSRFVLLFFFWYRETKSGAFEETLKEYLKGDKRRGRCNGYMTDGVTSFFALFVSFIFL